MRKLALLSLLAAVLAAVLAFSVGFGTSVAISHASGASATSPAADFKQYVADAQASTFYNKWSQQNPGELARWVGYRDALLTGHTPPPPVMTTRFGASLADAGVLYLDAPQPATTTTTASTSPTSTSTVATTTAPATTTTTSPPTPLIFDGRASRMTALYCTVTYAFTSTCNESPQVWDSIGFCNGDIQLQPDARFGQIYQVRDQASPRSGYCPASSFYADYYLYSSLNHNYPNPNGQTLWYADSINLPQGFNFIDPGWQSLMQIGFGPVDGPVQLVLRQGAAGTGVYLYRSGGQFSSCNPVNGWPPLGTLYPDATAIEGRWLDWVVGVHWSGDNTGWIQVYTRTDPSQPFTLAYSVSAVPTIQWGTCGSNSWSQSGAAMNDQMNLYEGYWDQRSYTQFPASTLRRRGYVIAPDLATAEASFPAAAAPATTTATTTTATATTATTPAGPQPPSAPGSWTLAFDDEFDSLNTSIWGPRWWWNGDTFWPTSELEVYRPSAASGALTLTAQRATGTLTNFNGNTANSYGQPFSWTSGLETTGGVSGSKPIGFAQRYGYFEARIQMPAGVGLWPAFWMEGVNGSNGQLASSYNDGSEIDVMEVIGADPSNLQMHLHGAAEYGASYQSPVALMGGGYHTYAVDWEPGFVAWYFDGQKVTQYTGSSFDNQPPHYLMLNLAVGGPSSWGGAPNSSTPSPATMTADYVRVWHH